MSDLISRQMALDAFGLSEKTRKYGGDHSGYDTRMLYEIQDTLENLPAVQPDHNADIGKKVCVDVISRQKAIEAIVNTVSKIGLHDNSEVARYGATFRQHEILDIIRRLPSVQLEQVCVATVTLTDEQLKEAVEKAKNAVISVIEPEPHWIPCSERLPETYGAYLVQDVWGYIFVDHWRGGWLAKTTMVAWRELPEPYKGVEQSEL